MLPAGAAVPTGGGMFAAGGVVGAVPGGGVVVRGGVLLGGGVTGGVVAGGVTVGCVGIEMGGGVSAELPAAPCVGEVNGGVVVVPVGVPVVGEPTVPFGGPATSSAPQPRATKIPAAKMLARIIFISTSTDDTCRKAGPAWTKQPCAV
jgi:hypothetical protein